ncbi:MAG TPA: hypothetical protein VGX25_00910 [Actinophytocola sp.]|uniref:hypothetical protein n=1 Tax=Actinophytocola sp. TaxID=1872138 RepID=UPI002DDCDE23|nr:hypothetical protein [Actinophytocola sp.]HEV2777936.1 hypothetical protein [Actinophytocola sp.]
MTQPVVPGSGSLTQDERVLAARVQGLVEIAPDTPMIKLLAPGELERYLRREVSQGEWGRRPPFDFRTVGGIVARAQDTTNLRTPVEFMRAFRVDYPGSPFRPDQPVVHVMEFLAVQPGQFVIPLGAPASLDPSAGLRPNTPAVRDAAYAMIDAAATAGLDPNTYRMEIAPWPYTGTGVTADPELGVPERWKRPSTVPSGATIFQYDPSARKLPVAIYRGAALGWEQLR